jgi:Raf kinase inhibitor-like YbhB/YbcL family protein
MQDELDVVSRRSVILWRAIPLLLCALVLVASVACGGASSATVPSSPVASVSPHAAKVAAVAFVGGAPITRASYRHWSHVEARLGVGGNVGHQALGFLLTSQWVLDEAAKRKLSISEAEVKLYLAKLDRQRFPRSATLAKFLARSGETEADLLARARVEILRARIAATVGAATTGAQTASVLASFQQSFRRRWQRVTTCEPAYLMEDCSGYRGRGEHLAASTPAASNSSTPPTASSPSSGASPVSGARRASRHHAAHAPTLNVEQESPAPRSGEMALSSPAFALNGAIPVQYTCDGAGVSPELRWQDVPANAAALVLFVIDEETAGPNGGIRWVVGDIDPKSTGVSAGHTPQGGIVGTNAQGHAGYGGICPKRGATTRVAFLLYALSKRIALTPGFQPSVAEHEYGSQGLRVGRAASTYGGYHRP